MAELLVVVDMQNCLWRPSAARVVMRDQPAAIDESLAAIERAGGNALGATRRMARVLRAQADLPSHDGAARHPGTALADIADLAHRFDCDPSQVTLRLPERCREAGRVPRGGDHRVPGGPGGSHQRAPACPERDLGLD